MEIGVEEELSSMSILRSVRTPSAASTLFSSGTRTASAYACAAAAFASASSTLSDPGVPRPPPTPPVIPVMLSPPTARSSASWRLMSSSIASAGAGP